MRMNDRSLRGTFPDITSRGVQTDEDSSSSFPPLLPLAAASPQGCNRHRHSLRPIPKTLPNVVTPPWARNYRANRAAAGQGITLPSSAPKRVRTFPMSNRACEPRPDPPVATEFDLRSFAFTTLPSPHTSLDKYNDDLTIEHYAPSDRSYSGKQRKGISEPFPDSTTHREHIEAALAAKFPFNEDTPLPDDLTAALIYNRDNDSNVVAEFRQSQLKRLRVIADECRFETNEWYSHTNPAIGPATGSVHIALLAHLARFTRMRGTNWLMQFVTGFPIVGHLHQAGVFPSGKDTPPTLPNPDSLFDSKTARFRARAPRSTSRSSFKLWEEAMSQVDEGWLCEPEPLDSDGNYRDRPLSKCNIAFRFGVEQSDKLRGCDDFRDSLTNTACHIGTPITLPGWDHIVAAAKILAGAQRPWAFGKIDHRAAYKALPLTPDHVKYAVIALWNPIQKGWFAFRPRTQLFGSIAAVLHYNCLSRLIASLACRILLIPTIGYFDDFGFLVNASDTAGAMDAFNEFFDILGLELKREKSAIGISNIFLGLSAQFPSPENSMTLTLSLSPDKATKWSESILEIIEAQSITHATLESLIGRLAFAQTAVFGRFARAMLKPLYAKLYAPRFVPTLSQALIRNLSWWATTLKLIHPRVVKFSRSKPDWVIYTDAAFEEGALGARLAAIFFEISPSPCPFGAELVLASAPGNDEIAFFETTSTIFGLELSAVVLAIFHFRESLRGQTATVYMDNNAALAAIINGDSSSPAAFTLIATLWFIAATYNIALWFERVHTLSNIADLPTRSKPLPFPVKNTMSFPPLREAVAYYGHHIAHHSHSLAELSLASIMSSRS